MGLCWAAGPPQRGGNVQPSPPVDVCWLQGGLNAAPQALLSA